MAAEMRERWPVNQTESYRIFQQTLPWRYRSVHFRLFWRACMQSQIWKQQGDEDWDAGMLIPPELLYN